MDEPDDRDPRVALTWYWLQVKIGWQKLLRADQRLHDYLNTHFPVAVRVADAVLAWLYDFLVSPAFSVILAFLLVGLVIADVTSFLVSISAIGASVVASLWIAKSEFIKNLRIHQRLAFFLITVGFMTFAGHLFAKWCLTHYYEKHPIAPVATATPQTPPQQVSADDLAYKRIKELLEQQHRPPATVSPRKNSLPVEKPQPVPLPCPPLENCPPQKIKQWALGMADGIDAIYNSYKNDEREVIHAYNQRSDAEKARTKSGSEFELNAYKDMALNTYRKQYRANALPYRRAMERLIGPTAHDEQKEMVYDIYDANLTQVNGRTYFPYNWQIDNLPKIAADLRSLAMRLPDTQ